MDLYEEPGVKSENGEPVVNRVLTIMLADEYRAGFKNLNRTIGGVSA
jgi:hypothetical protein